MSGRPSPHRRDAYPHARVITTRWMDNDPYGHMNNAVHYSLFDTAVNTWLIEQGALDFRNGSVVGLVVETGCHYFAELGYPEFTARVWFGLFLRAGTSPDVVARLLDAAKAAHADPDVRAKLEAQGFDMSGQTGPEFTADIRAQSERWARLIKASGYKAD